MKKLSEIFLTMMILFAACKEDTQEPQQTSWSEKDQAYYHNVIELQKNAFESYKT